MISRIDRPRLGLAQLGDTIVKREASSLARSSKCVYSRHMSRFNVCLRDRGIVDGFKGWLQYAFVKHWATEADPKDLLIAVLAKRTEVTCNTICFRHLFDFRVRNT